jgi:integrase
MPRQKLTVKAIEKLAAPTTSGRQEITWDAELRGFGVLCSGVSNSKSYIVQRDLPDGKTRRVTLAAVNETKLEEARIRAGRLLVDLRDGKDPKRKNTGNRTLQQTLDAYLKTNKEISDRSREIYQHLVAQHLTPWLTRPLASITPAEVDSLHRAIAAKVAKRGQHSGHSVANDAMRAFRLLYNWAANRDDDMPRNPVRLRKNEWHRVEPQRKPIPETKMPAWYAAVMDLPPMGRDYLLLLLFTGLRRREAAALTWAEVDFPQRLIRLSAERNKAGRPLDLPMSDVVRDLLVTRRQIGNAKFVFPSYGSSGHIEGARPWTDVVREATGIEFTLHDLRRTFVTYAESTDISVYALKALINHSLGAGVTEGYIDMKPERLREPVQKVCDKIKALCRVPMSAKVAGRI